MASAYLASWRDYTSVATFPRRYVDVPFHTEQSCEPLDGVRPRTAGEPLNLAQRLFSDAARLLDHEARQTLPDPKVGRFGVLDGNVGELLHLEPQRVSNLHRTTRTG